MLFNAYAPSSYFVFTHHSQDFHYNTFYLFHNLVILSLLIKMMAFMLFNAYAPSSYFVFTHHSQDFHYNTFYLFHNLVILSFYVL